MRCWSQVCVLYVVMMLGIVSAPNCASADDVQQSDPKTLIFVVPGTYGNDEFWPNVVPGKSTFGSELERGAGEGAQIYPFLWLGKDDQPSRMKAAKDLAGLIDDKGAAFDRICIVGHSHGGNIGLMAAGMCHHKIDAVVCIETPYPYLLTRNSDGKELPIPIYCSWEARHNIRDVITLRGGQDIVTDILAPLPLPFGLTTPTAITMTTSWREHLNFPRLLSDAIGHLQSDLAWSARLSVADANIAFRSFVPDLLLGGKDLFSTPRHSAAHSRRMGYLTGQLLGRTPKDAAIALSTLVQPSDADDGEPISNQAYQEWLEQHAADFVHVGWRLSKITVHVSSADPSGEPAGAGPDVALYISSPRTAGSLPWLQTMPWLKGGYDATWSPQAVIMKGRKCELTLESRTRDKLANLGGYSLGMAGDPPKSLVSGETVHAKWTAELQWDDLHS